MFAVPVPMLSASTEDATTSSIFCRSLTLRHIGIVFGMRIVMLRIVPSNCISLNWLLFLEFVFLGERSLLLTSLRVDSIRARVGTITPLVTITLRVTVSKTEKEFFIVLDGSLEFGQSGVVSRIKYCTPKAWRIGENFGHDLRRSK